ncbi:MFS transporter [Streptomyces sp. NBC_01176]|uniref:MFS transporter n=1 Tax=Streptomyces sp. NBC_01176 TaxID=2903760 RepID=UPI00386995AB|nr:MFS transporter [Streptomyces sp. NBC_01176]WSS89393.1 MFS transporter [Streptomyces sp. NBC_01176]
MNGAWPRPMVPPGGTSLLLVGLVDATGTGLYLAGAVLFFTKIVGLNVAQVGTGLSVAGVLGFLAPVPFGRLADGRSPRMVLIGLHLTCAIGFAAYAFVDDFVSFLVVAGLLGVAEQAARPMNQALAEQVVGEEHRTRMSATLRVVYNVGYTGGALLAALAIQTGTRTSFLAVMVGDALSFLLSAILLAFLRVRPGGRPPRAAVGGDGPPFPALRDRWYIAASGVNAVLLLHMTLLSVGVPLWITTRTSAPEWVVAVVLVVNTVLAVLFQVRVARGTEKVSDGAVALRRAGMVLALCCGCFAAAAYVGSVLSALAVILTGTVLLTWGELLQSAGQWSLSFGLAPTRSRVEYLAAFHLGSSVQVAVGPMLVTVGVIANGPAGWAGLAVAFLGAGLLARWVAEKAEGRLQLAAENPDTPELQKSITG